MNIRMIQEGDFDQWLVLWQGYLDFYKVDLGELQNRAVWMRLMNEADPLQGFAAVEDDRLIGFAHFFFHGTTWYQTSYCYLEDLYVDQTVRSRGTGRALIAALKEVALSKGAAKLYWHTDKQNETAQALYNKVADLTDFIRYDIAL
ncbi:N-acetyltransferase [Terasakiella brassicae]|uniref:N-acetyltransferase n=1 Tax=Terasakiella brassicae TaxID=1634917 RepID=A0A917C3I0_9PROT|nr:GNAT family N-acetyltransferase [Terasakiella brassicae]GGF68230.1 N-acetyltransferase [Terasakiella brassicae]